MSKYKTKFFHIYHQIGELKKCYSCECYFLLSEFNKDSYKWDNLDGRCKVCSKKRYKKYYDNNEKFCREKRKTYYYKVKDDGNYLIKQREIRKKYYKKNKQKILDKNKKYYDNNRDIINKKKYLIKKGKLNKNSLFKLKERIRNVVRKSIVKRKFKKNSLSRLVLGCNWETLEKHLCETWEINYGIGREYIPWDKVHIDHIIPISLASNEESVYQLNYYTNLQLLLAEDNLEKSNKLDWKLQ